MTSRGAGWAGIGGLVALAGLGWLASGGGGTVRNPRRRYEAPRDPDAAQAYRGFMIVRGLDGLFYVSKGAHGYGGGRPTMAAAKRDVDEVA